jgi:hypothetical protein
MRMRDFLGGSVMHAVRMGTCGWSYKEWAGVFYPKDLAPADWLAYYAEHYPVVEVDSAFYRSPARQAVEGWRDRTRPAAASPSRCPRPSPTRRSCSTAATSWAPS